MWNMQYMWRPTSHGHSLIPPSAVRIQVRCFGSCGNKRRGGLCGGTVLRRCVVIHRRFRVRSVVLSFAPQQCSSALCAPGGPCVFLPTAGVGFLGLHGIVLARTDEPNGEPRGKKSPKLREKRGLLARPSGLAKETGFWGLCRSTKRRKREHVGSHLIDTKARLNVCTWAKRSNTQPSGSLLCGKRVVVTWRGTAPSGYAVLLWGVGLFLTSLASSGLWFALLFFRLYGGFAWI